MRFYDLKPGSQEWIDIRLGKPTSSNFSKIITAKTWKRSTSDDGYINKLIGEWALGRSLDDDITDFMERGRELEKSAVDYFELVTGIPTINGGFCETDPDRFGDLGIIGCSPDRLIGDDGGLEIKCPGIATHIGYLVGDPASEFIQQVQGSMYVTGRKFWYWLSYNPELPPALICFERDKNFIAALEALMVPFLEKLADRKRILLERGFVPALAA